MFAPPLLAALLLASPPAPVDSAADGTPPPADGAAAKEEENAEAPKWRSLFDGKTLDGWEVTPFGGQGDVGVEDGAILLPFGNNLSGVTVSEKVGETLPATDYVLELDAKRISGTDFFCGLTVPVWSPKEGKSSHATLILGGWGGGLVGLSSINKFDASENPTTTYRRFADGRWYKVRMEVTRSGVRALLDGEELFAADIRESQVGTRSEMTLSKPLGVASYITTAAIRKVRIRPLTEAEIAAVDEACAPFDPTGGDRPVNEFGESE